MKGKNSPSQQEEPTTKMQISSGKQLFQGKDPLQASEWITMNIHILETFPLSYNKL